MAGWLHHDGGHAQANSSRDGDGNEREPHVPTPNSGLIRKKPFIYADSDEGGQRFRSIADTIPMIADRRPVDGRKGVTGPDWRQALTFWLPLCACCRR